MSVLKVEQTMVFGCIKTKSRTRVRRIVTEQFEFELNLEFEAQILNIKFLSFGHLISISSCHGTVTLKYYETRGESTV